MGWAEGFASGSQAARGWVDTYNEAMKQKQDDEYAAQVQGLLPQYTQGGLDDRRVQGTPDQLQRAAAETNNLYAQDAQTFGIPAQQVQVQAPSTDYGGLYNQLGMARIKQSGRSEEGLKLMTAGNEFNRQAVQDQRAATEFGWKQGTEARAQTLSESIGAALKLPDGPEKQQAINAAYAAARDPTGGLQHQHLGLQVAGAQGDLAEKTEARDWVKKIAPVMNDPVALAHTVTAFAHDHPGGALGSLAALETTPALDAKGQPIKKNGMPVFNFWGMDKSTGKYLSAQMTSQDAMAQAFKSSGNMTLMQLGNNIEQHGMDHVLKAIDEVTKSNAVGVKEEVAGWKAIAMQQKNSDKFAPTGRSPDGQVLWSKIGEPGYFDAGGKKWEGDVSQVRGLDAPIREAKAMTPTDWKTMQENAQSDPRVAAAPKEQKGAAAAAVMKEQMQMFGYAQPQTGPDPYAALLGSTAKPAAQKPKGLAAPAPRTAAPPAPTVQIGRSSTTLAPTEWILQAPTVRGGKAYYLNIRTQQQIPAN